MELKPFKSCVHIGFFWKIVIHNLNASSSPIGNNFTELQWTMCLAFWILGVLVGYCSYMHVIFLFKKCQKISKTLACIHEPLLNLNQCCVRIQVVKFESESESWPLSPSPSENKNLSPSHKSSSPHFQHLFIFQNMETNNKTYRMSE